MISTGYAFTSAYLKGEEARLVVSEHVTRLLRASDIQDALGVIKDTDIGSYLEEVPMRTFDDIEVHLWAYFRKCIERLEWFKLLPSGMSRLLRAYVVKYDVLNVKTALRAVSAGRQLRMVPVGVIQSRGLLDTLAQAENLNDIVEILTTCKLGNYADILQEQEKNITGEGKPRLLAESKLDGEYFANMLSTARATGNGDLLSRAFGFIIDLTNLQIACRAIVEGMGTDAADYAIPGGYLINQTTVRDMLSSKLGDIPQKLENARYREIASEIASAYDKTESIATVQEIVDKHKFKLLEEMLSPRLMSPLVMAWYLVLKETEVRNVRLILKAIVDRVPVEEIKDYLVVRP
ncbi:MAG: V-type ATPase subunit [Chloroflexota bacterium]|nr:V-type ATPase subunit [Chloroflexota bacterium]